MGATVPIDATLTFILGVWFYTAARKGIQPGDPLLKNRAFIWGMGYNIFVGMGIALTAYFINPDWMWMYWVDPTRLPAAFEVYVFLMYPAMFTLGFLLTDQLERLREGASVKLLGIFLAFLTVFIVVTFPRLWGVGTFGDWINNSTVPMIGGEPFAVTTLAQALLAGFGIAVISLVWLLLKIRATPSEEKFPS